MKNLTLILAILTISFSCKKESKLTVNEEAEIPVKTSKSFTAKILYHQDSTAQFPSGNIAITLDTVATGTPNWYFNNQQIWCGTNVNDYDIITPKISYATNNLNKPMKFYIHINVVRFRNSNLGCSMRSNTSVISYTKEYTFQEGDNGIVNFNNLP